MKKFIVNSGILSSQVEVRDCSVVIPKMLKQAGIKDVRIRTCYCCHHDRKVIFEADAQTKESLSTALGKIDFPVESIMEAEKTSS
jgi:hypothetical protein